jgi:MFS family permease
MTEAGQTKRAWRLPALLHDRQFRLFWTGQTVSMLGDQVSGLAVPLLAVLVLHANAAQMGLLTAIGLAPSLLLSVLAGSFIDRRGRRRRTMLVSDLVRAVLLVSIPVAYAFGHLGMPQLFVVAFCLGTGDVFFDLAYNTLFVSMVRPDQYVEGNSLLNGSRALSYVAGQSVAGILVSVLTAPVTLLVDAGSFLVSAAALIRIHPTEPAPEAVSAGHIAAGARFIRTNSIVRASLLATATINFFNFMFAAIFVLYVTTELHVPAAQLGLALGAGAVGGLIGSALTGRLTRRIGIGPALMVSYLLFPAPLLLVPLAGGGRPLVLVLLFVAEFVSGLGVMLLDISLGAIFQTAVPEVLLARVSGAYRTVNYGMRPLGALSAGVLGTAIGLRPTLWIATGGALLAILWTLPSPIRHLRAVEDAAPAMPAMPDTPAEQAG